MIKNNASLSNDRIDLQRACIEHRATWFALMIEEAKKQGLGAEFAHNAVLRCGKFHGEVKFPKTESLTEFAAAFADTDTKNCFEMEILESTEEKLSIDFHYCPLLNAWKKLGLPDEAMPELCDIAMDGDRGIISTYPGWKFELGDTIANGDDVCQIRITNTNV